MSRHDAYEFGGYRFEPFNARLVRGGEVIPLTSKAVDTLSVLVDQPNVLVSKDTLMAAVWPGIAVEENNLNQQISALRKALSHGDQGVAIETVPRRGYRLVAPVRRIAVSTGSLGEPRPATSDPVVTPAEIRPRPVVSPIDRTPHLRRRRWYVVAALLAILGVVGVSSDWYQRRSAASGESAGQDARHRSGEAMARGQALQRAGNVVGALAEMQEAVRLDPTNAKAYGSLAHALNAVNRPVSTSAVRPAGESPSVQAAQRGVALDPLCGDCHGTLGLFLFYHDWKFSEAEAHFREAIRLAPDDAGIRPAYAMLLAVTGRPDEAVTQVDIGLAAEPFKLSWLEIRASALYFGRKYEEAIATADRALAVQNNYRPAWEWRSRALFQLGRGREGLHALAQDLFASHSAELDQAVRKGGVDGGLRKALELTDDWRGRIESAWRRAAWRALLNDTSGALEELERARDNRRFNAINLGADPAYDKIRAHPRFQRILVDMGLDTWFPPIPSAGQGAP